MKSSWGNTGLMSSIGPLHGRNDSTYATLMLKRKNRTETK